MQCVVRTCFLHHGFTCAPQRLVVPRPGVSWNFSVSHYLPYIQESVQEELDTGAAAVGDRVEAVDWGGEVWSELVVV